LKRGRGGYFFPSPHQLSRSLSKESYNPKNEEKIPKVKAKRVERPKEATAF
jgi:hypothetical protein